MGEKIGYVRVSTAEQNTARQEELLHRLEVDKLFIEKVSGKTMDRPELKKLLEYVREGDTVIVESYSRFARSTKDLLNLIEQLERKKVKFISQKENINTSTPEGRLMMTIFAGLAQFERESILQRQREGIEIAKAEGRMTGRPKKTIPGFELVYQKVCDGEIKITDVCKQYNISRSTWYAMVERYQNKLLEEFNKPVRVL